MTRVHRVSNMTRSTATQSAPAATDSALDLLRAQATLYSKLDCLSSRQRVLVAADDVGPLLALLADRQRVSEQLSVIAERLAPIRRNWSDFRGRLTEDQRDEADRLVRESGLRLQNIMDADERDARVLSGRKQEISRGLCNAHAVGEAICAYRGPGSGAATSNRMDEDG